MVVVPHFTVFVVERTTTTTFVCILELPQLVVSQRRHGDIFAQDTSNRATLLHDMLEKSLHDIGPAVCIRFLAILGLPAHAITAEPAWLVRIANVGVGAPLVIGQLQKRLKVDIDHKRDWHLPFRVQ